MLASRNFTKVMRVPTLTRRWASAGVEPIVYGQPPTIPERSQHPERSKRAKDLNEVVSLLEPISTSPLVNPTLISFDIEQNGLKIFNPRMIELGWTLFDEHGKPLQGYPMAHIIDPRDWKEVRMTRNKIHKIRVVDLYKFGKPLNDVLKLFWHDLKQVMEHPEGKITSYRLENDKKILLQSFEESGRPAQERKRISTFIEERGSCVLDEARAALEEKKVIPLADAFEKLSSLPKDTIKGLVEKEYMAGTGSAIAGMTFLEARHYMAHKGSSSSSPKKTQKTKTVSADE